MPPGLVRARRERLVGTEDEGQRALDQQAARFDHVCDRRVGRQAQRIRRYVSTDMVTAEGHRRHRRAVLAAWGEADLDPRAASQPVHDANDADRREHAAVLKKPRREVDDLQPCATRVRHLGAHDRRVALIGLSNRDAILQFDVEPALIAVIVEQRTEHRITVEARYAHPHDARTRVDQRTDARVADDPKLKIRCLRFHRSSFLLRTPARAPFPPAAAPGRAARDRRHIRESTALRATARGNGPLSSKPWRKASASNARPRPSSTPPVKYTPPVALKARHRSPANSPSACANALAARRAAVSPACARAATSAGSAASSALRATASNSARPAPA